MLDTKILDSAETAFWVVSVLLQAALLLRLWRSGLLWRYRWFASFLALHLVEAGVLSQIDRLTNTYAYAFFGFAVVFSILLVLVILELFGMIFQEYSGIGTVGRWLLGGGLAVATVVSVLSLSPDLANTGDTYPLLLYFSVFERAVYSALLLFVVFIALFLVWFPVPLSRNTVVHTILFGFAFCTRALLHLVRNVFGYERGLVHFLSALDLGVFVICLTGWIFFLKESGEQKTVVVGHRWRPEESERLSGQLDAINHSLLRAARK